MSRTLFWYILKDLLRIFLLTSAALAGIMSFGGLLRPLTEHGLNAAQVGMMLGCFVPAMTTYSFPIAALFATSMVYGRLSADNELTACRSTGISYLSLTTPALVLGLLVALLSLVCLCFVVPVFTLQVERIIYSNLAQLVQNEIDKTHQIKMDEFCVSAPAARVLEGDEKRVELTAPMIVSWTIPPQDALPGQRMRAPYQFWTAKSAVAYLDQQDDEVELRVVLTQGNKFPRYLTQGPHATVEKTRFGPVPFPSPIKEDPKFMQIQKLKSMYVNPESSKRLSDVVAKLIRQEQVRAYLEHLDDLVSTGPVTISNDTYLRLFVLSGLVSKTRSFTFESSPEAGGSDAKSLCVLARGHTPVFPDDGGELVLRSAAHEPALRIEARYQGEETALWQGRELHIRAEAVEPMKLADGNLGKPRLAVTFQGFDQLQAAPAPGASRPAIPQNIASFSAKMMVLMPQKMWNIDPVTGDDFSQTTLTLTRGDQETLLRHNDQELLLRSDPESNLRQVKLVVRRNGIVDSTWEVRSMPLWAEPQLPQGNATERVPLLKIIVEGYDVLIDAPVENGPELAAQQGNQANDAAALELAQHKTFRTELSIPMPDSLQQMLHMTIQDLKDNSNFSQSQRNELTQTASRWSAKLLSEINSRASLAISCLVLVLVGCALGMMFRSGNFLSAFAVSFVPAMLCIALIVTGQQICSRVNGGKDLGLAFIWSGNIIVFILSVGLLGRLQRQ